MRELVPDDVILGLVRRYCGGGGSPGLLFDGFPGRSSGGEALDRLLREAGQRLDAVVVIDVPDDELVKG